MASSDFDDIFGDLKEDEHFTASLTTAELDDDIFGDSSSVATKPTAVTKAATSPTKASDGQDEFLSWLDDGPSTSNATASSSAAAAAPSPATKAPTPPKAPSMATIDLGDGDDDFLTTTAPPPTTSTTYTSHSSMDTFDEEPLDSPLSSGFAVQPMPPSIPVHVTAPHTHHATISLDDDDDDDLEKIIEHAKANARKTGSRESSHSSLQIKSQSHRHDSSSHYDVVGLTKQYLETGVISTPAARVAMWQHALASTTSATKDTASISMYAVQTTPLDLPNQSVLRKDVEIMCTTIFSSGLHAETIHSNNNSNNNSAAAHESGDATRLLFIDNAEILITYLCKKLHLAEYPLGFAFAFGPALAASGNDPLQLELIATMQAACHHVLPHLAKQIAPQQIADARRALLKLLLLYHAPQIAFHLDQHFHQWNLEDSVIPDTWLSSMFETEGYRSGFDFLIKIWDCCLLMDINTSTTSHATLAKTNAFPATTACFIVVHLIAKAEKKLMRMEGDQLRHCMAQTIQDALKNQGDPLILDVRRLIEATPSSMCIKLRDAGITAAAASTMSASSDSLAAASGSKSTSNTPFSFIAASTNGVMQVGSMVLIDMPTKLLTTMVPIKFPGSLASSSSSSGAGAKDHSANEAFFTQLMREATPSSSVCVTLAASEVIPQIFRSFQAPQQDSKIRYFMIDCRAAEETHQGKIPTAFHFDPDAVTNPAVLDTVLATLEPLKTTVHMCVMGHGYGHIADDLRQLLASPQSNAGASSQPLNELPFFLKDDFLESFARDISRVNAAVLFLAKRGFPHVSVLDGGYAAAHAQLLTSSGEGYSVADLIDHDAPQCSLCQHRRVTTTTARTESRSSSSKIDTSSAVAMAAGVANAGNESTPPSRGSSAATMPPQLGHRLSSSGSGELDARSLFDGHASPSGSSGSYFSSFAGALKTSGKAMGMGMMNPTSTLKDGPKWLMGKKTGGSTAGSAPVSPVPAGGDGNSSPSSPAARSPMSAASGLANLSKLKSSLSHLGSESLDMLKKAEPSQFKGMFSVASASNVKTATHTTASSSSSASSMPSGAHSHGGSGGNGGGGGSRNGSFQRAEEDVFSIDDDDEEEQDDFVGGGASRHGGGSSRSSSSSSLGHRTDSFSGSVTGGGGNGSESSTVALHTVEQGKIKELTKGMRVSRTQMLPFVASTFFSAYKKKKPLSPTSPAAAAPGGRASMLPRRLVVAENHVLVLKAERNMDDVYCVKSCHHLAHLARMTCLKKNALMVTMYYKCKAPHSGEIVEKKNAYEVQQRDEFIKVVKTAMEKM